MASPRYEGSPEPPNLRVQRLESSGDADAESVVMVKLTDEMFSALVAASKKHSGKLQLRVDSKGGTFDLGSYGVFHFQSQMLNGETDTVSEDSANQKYHMTGSYRTKYQIQATDKSFADTREKAQKLMEEEKSRGTKEANTRLTKNIAPRIGSASSSRHASPLLAKTDPNSKISPNKFSNSTGINGVSNNGSNRQIVDPLAGELRKKKIRTRVVHLIVTGKYSSVDEISHQLRKEGVNEDDGWIRKVEEISNEVSERSNNKLFLKPTCYPEIDPRWAWFNREEKEAVRRMLASTSSKQQHISSAFAPMRKKGIERMQAPTHGITVSPEVIPTPPASRPASGDGSAKSKSISPPVQKTTPVLLSPSPRADLVEYPSTIISNKRTAHVPSSGAVTAKRPRQESNSPPEDPTNSTTSLSVPKKQPVLLRGSGGSTTSSRLSSPCSLSSPQNPSCDWEKKFPEIKSVAEAEKYFNMFHSDYPTYMECFRQLHQVAQEFRDFEEKLKKVGRNSKESLEIERDIQKRFARFEKNDTFLKSRQQHADLRSKLTVLKQRISDWERSQDSQAIF